MYLIRFSYVFIIFLFFLNNNLFINAGPYRPPPTSDGTFDGQLYPDNGPIIPGNSCFYHKWCFSDAYTINTINRT